MSEITENYIVYEALVSYLSEQKNWSYRGFLNLNQDIIVTSLISLTNNSPLTLANWENFDTIWYNRFLNKAKDLFEPNIFITIKKKITTEHLQQRKNLQTFWEVVIKEYKKKYLIPASLSKKTLNQHEHEKENLTSAFLLKEKKEILDQQEENLMPAFTTITSLSKETFKNKKKIVDQNLVPTIIIPKETVNIKLINFCYDILHQLENSPYANLFYKKKGELKRTRDNDTNTNNSSTRPQKKQNQILEENKNNEIYKQNINNTFPVTSAYENLVIGTGDNYIGLELKYISLIGLVKNQNTKYGANELENLDKMLEKENEEFLLKRPYSYWSKEYKKTNQTTIVIGFRRILWKPVEEVVSDYTYNKI
ncbi:hypothetical protein GLOIN_2v1779806 [Rhizophagus clarus]|uniref:Uncharacterized protein n=1 Tax=Rhizophagus clarus TaxID=94130 RepID=A0A8H3LK30_9GLOM|nr:hypothetical protein GLOIN_2v1779806 [Rhizophagus clarus]